MAVTAVPKSREPDALTLILIPDQSGFPMGRSALLTASVFLLAAGVPGGSESGPRLPVPKGWRTEDTAYPPPWAKELPWVSVHGPKYRCQLNAVE
jgi:hypothetical protein